MNEFLFLCMNEARKTQEKFHWRKLQCLHLIINLIHVQSAGMLLLINSTTFNMSSFLVLHQIFHVIFCVHGSQWEFRKCLCLQYSWACRKWYCCDTLWKFMMWNIFEQTFVDFLKKRKMKKMKTCCWYCEYMHSMWET